MAPSISPFPPMPPKVTTLYLPGPGSTRPETANSTCRAPSSTSRPEAESALSPPIRNVLRWLSPTVQRSSRPTSAASTALRKGLMSFSQSLDRMLRTMLRIPAQRLSVQQARMPPQVMPAVQALALALALAQLPVLARAQARDRDLLHLPLRLLLLRARRPRPQPKCM